MERSRQSARECRARKKLRYDYLDDLVLDRERAVEKLQNELNMYEEWCKLLDHGQIPPDLQKVQPTSSAPTAQLAMPANLPRPVDLPPTGFGQLSDGSSGRPPLQSAGSDTSRLI